MNTSQPKAHTWDTDSFVEAMDILIATTEGQGKVPFVEIQKVLLANVEQSKVIRSLTTTIEKLAIRLKATESYIATTILAAKSKPVTIKIPAIEKLATRLEATESYIATAILTTKSKPAVIKITKLGKDGAKEAKEMPDNSIGISGDTVWISHTNNLITTLNG